MTRAPGEKGCLFESHLDTIGFFYCAQDAFMFSHKILGYVKNFWTVFHIHFEKQTRIYIYGFALGLGFKA